MARPCRTLARVLDRLARTLRCQEGDEGVPRGILTHSLSAGAPAITPLLECLLSPHNRVGHYLGPYISLNTITLHPESNKLFFKEVSLKCLQQHDVISLSIL